MIEDNYKTDNLDEPNFTDQDFSCLVSIKAPAEKKIMRGKDIGTQWPKPVDKEKQAREEQ